MSTIVPPTYVELEIADRVSFLQKRSNYSTHSSAHRESNDPQEWAISLNIAEGIVDRPLKATGIIIRIIGLSPCPQVVTFSWELITLSRPPA
jgi:hypothetical protein